MESDNELSLGDYLAAVKRRLLLVAMIALPIVVGGVVLAMALPDVYRSTATFRLVTDPLAEAAIARREYADRYVFAIADKVLASEILADIVKELNPYPDIDGSDPVGSAIAKLRSDTDVEMVTQKVLDPTSGREVVINIGFDVSFSHSRPEMSEKVATGLKDAFVQVGRSDQRTAAANRLEFFAGETDRLSQQIAEFERRLAEFKSANFQRLPESAQANITARGRLEQELDGAEREISTLRQNRVFITQQLRQEQAGRMAGNLRQLEEEYTRKSAVYAETHPDLIALRRQIDNIRRGGSVATGNTLQAQVEQEQALLAEARQRYNDDHPDVRRIVRNIEALKARIAAGEGIPAGAGDTLMSVQLQTQLNSVDAQIGGLQARALTLRSRLNQLDAQLGSAPEVEREYQAITRGLASAREQYNQMIAKRRNAEVALAAISGGGADGFTLFSAPSTPWKPAGPPRLGIVVVALLLSLFLSLAAVVLAEIADSNVRGTRDVRSLWGKAPLAVIPNVWNSVERQRRMKKVRALVASILIGAPILFLVTRFVMT